MPVTRAALGHDGCNPHGDINEFGNAFRYGVTRSLEAPKTAEDDDAAKISAWTLEFCLADSDSDGVTNGDELGDGCCAWRGQDSDLLFYDRVVGDNRNISNPTSDISIPSRPLCSGAGIPEVPADVMIVQVSSVSLTVEWAPPPSSSACVCEYALRVLPVTGGGNASERWAFTRGDATSITACGLAPSTNYSLTLYSINRDGRSDTYGAPHHDVYALTMPASHTDTRMGLPCTSYMPVSLDPIVYRIYTDSIGNASFRFATGALAVTQAESAPLSAALVPAALTLLLVLLFRAISARSRGCSLKLWAMYFSGYMDCARRSARGSGHRSAPHTCRGATRQCCRASATGLWEAIGAHDLSQSSRFFVLLVLVACTAVALAWAVSAEWYARYMVYSPAQVSGVVFRAAGYALCFSIGLQLVPITRWSPILSAFGVSFERGVMFHKWLAPLSAALTLVHGVGLAILYARSRLGAGYLLLWDTTNLPVNPLAGTIAGLCMVALFVTAWEPIRRRWYELFLAGHALYPVIIVLSIMHTSVSETPALPLLLAGIAIVMFDHLLLVADIVLRPATILCARVLADDPEAGALVAIDLRKGGRWPWVDRVWPFHYYAGEYVYLFIPAVSLIPHPFSVSSAPLQPGRLTIHVRAMDAASFTAQVAQAIGQARAANGWTMQNDADTVPLLTGRSDCTSSTPCPPTHVSANPLSPRTGSTPVPDGGLCSPDHVRNMMRSERIAAMRGAGSSTPDQSTPPSTAAASPEANGATGGDVEPAPLWRALQRRPHAAVTPAIANAGPAVNGASNAANAACHDEDRAPSGTGTWATAAPRQAGGSAQIGRVTTSAGADTSGCTAPEFPLSVMVAGPFGVPTIPLEQYSHFVLVGGGIGVTPIASLHCSLVNGLPLHGPTWSARAARAWAFMSCRQPDRDPSVANVRTLVTAWAAREDALVDDVAPLLAAPATTSGNGLPFVCTFITQPGDVRPPPPCPVDGTAAALHAGVHRERARLNVENVVRAAVHRVREVDTMPPADTSGSAVADAGSSGMRKPDRPSTKLTRRAIAVIVCGPRTLVDATLRAAAAFPQIRTRPDDVLVHVHKELFAF